MLMRIALMGLSILAGLSAQSLRLVNEDPKFITAFGAASGRAVYTSAAHGFSNNDQVFCLIPSGRGLLGDSYRSPTAFNVRTVTAVTTNTFELLDEASSAVLDVANQTAIALDTKEATPRYGFCARFGTYSYRAGEIGGLIPIAGSTAMTNLMAAATGSPNRYASFLTHVNVWSTSGCDGSTAGACSVEESKIVATTVQNTTGDDLTFGYVPLNLALACQITASTRYCNSIKYYIKNVHRWLSGGQFAGCDMGVTFCGRGSMADWSAFGNVNAAQAYRLIRSSLSAGEQTDFLNRMTTNTGDSCTSQMGAVVARATGTTTTYTLDISAAAAGISPNDIIYLNDRRNRFQAADGTLQSLVVAAGVATITTSTAHSLVTNYRVDISGTPGAALDGNFKITGTSTISGVLRVATFATAAADGTYTTGASIQTRRDFNTNQQGIFMRVVSTSGNDITTNTNITTYASSTRSAIDAEIAEVNPWVTGNCGAIWFDSVHGNNPAPIVGSARVRFAGTASTSDTILSMTVAEIYRIQSSAGWAYLAGADQRYEIVRIDNVNTSTGQVTVTRGQFGTEPGSYTAADYMYVGRFPLAGTGTTLQWGDIWSNLTLTKTANSFITGLLLGYEDAEMRAFAEKNWFYYRAGQWPIYREHFNGMTLGGSTPGYHWGRYYDFNAEVLVSLTNTLSTEPTMGDDVFKGGPLDAIYRLLPGNDPAKDTYLAMHFSDGGITRSLENDDWGGLVMLLHRNPSWTGAGQFWTFYDDIVLANLGRSHENYIHFFPYSTEAGITSAKQPFSALNSWHFWDSTLKSASATDPNKLFGAMASRASWNAASDSLIVTYPDSPADHLSQYHPPGNWAWNRSQVEMASPSNRGIRLRNVAPDANGMVCIGATTSNNGCGLKAPSPFFNSDVVTRATHGSADTRYAAIGCKDTFDSTHGVTSCEAKIYHLITSDGKTHVIDYRRLQTGSAKQMWYQNSYYHGYSASGGEVAQSPSATTTRVGAAITYRSPQFNHSVLSTVLVQPSGSVYEDTAATLGADPTWGTKMRTVLASGTDFEHLTTHMSVSNITDTHPTTSLLLSDPGLRVLEISDGTVAWVLSLIRGTTSVTSQNFSSTHTGTGRYAVSGLQPNANYRVDRNSVTLYASLPAGIGGLIRFDGLSGTYAIVQTGAPPTITITTSSPLPSGTQNIAYSTNIAASNGVGAHSWSIVSGTPPPGLAISGTSATATISGTPTTPGFYGPFTVRVQDSLSNVATKDFTLDIATGAGVLLSATPGTLQFNYIIGGGNPPTQTFEATCANGSCSSTASADQSWCGVSPASGSTPRTYTVSITGSGLPIGNSTCTITVAAAEATNSPRYVGVSVSVTGPPSPPTISHNGQTSVTVGAAPGFDLAVTGGTAPYVFSQSGGTLPPGITGVDSSTGGLLGTPTALGAGDYSATFRVTDSADQTDEVTVVLTAQPSTGVDSVSSLGAAGDALLQIRRAAGLDAAIPCEYVVRLVSTGLAVASGTLTGAAATRAFPITGLGAGTYTGHVQCGANGGSSTSFILVSVSGTQNFSWSAGQPLGTSGGSLEYGTTSALGSSVSLTCNAGVCSASVPGVSTGRILWIRPVWTGRPVAGVAATPILIR